MPVVRDPISLYCVRIVIVSAKHVNIVQIIVVAAADIVIIITRPNVILQRVIKAADDMTELGLIHAIGILVARNRHGGGSLEAEGRVAIRQNNHDPVRVFSAAICQLLLRHVDAMLDVRAALSPKLVNR